MPKNIYEKDLLSFKDIVKIFVKTNTKILFSWILQSLCVILPVILLNIEDRIPGSTGNSIVFTTLLYTTFFVGRKRSVKNSIGLYVLLYHTY